MHGGLPAPAQVAQRLVLACVVESRDELDRYREAFNRLGGDVQAAVGLAQMDRLEGFIATRKRNFAFLKVGLRSCEDLLILPEATPGSDPAWFGFPITIRDDAPFTRAELLRFLDEGLGLLAEMVREPRFDAGEFDRLRAERLAEILARRKGRRGRPPHRSAVGRRCMKFPLMMKTAMRCKAT